MPHGVVSAHHIKTGPQSLGSKGRISQAPDSVLCIHAHAHGHNELRTCGCRCSCSETAYCSTAQNAGYRWGLAELLEHHCALKYSSMPSCSYLPHFTGLHRLYNVL